MHLVIIQVSENPSLRCNVRLLILGAVVNIPGVLSEYSFERTAFFKARHPPGPGATTTEALQQVAGQQYSRITGDHSKI